jgi:MoxR-like ATPase
MVAVDVLAAGSLFPAVRQDTQERNFKVFLDDLALPKPDAEMWSLLQGIFSIEVPASHTHYKGGKLQNYLSWLFGLRTLIVFDLAQTDRETLVATMRQEVSTVPNEAVWDSLIWGMLHTMYPDQLVAVPGDADRKLILRTFSSTLDGKEFPNDFAALDYLRHTLPQPSDEGPFDFYYPELLEQWGLSKHRKRLNWLESIGAWDSSGKGNDAEPERGATPPDEADPLDSLMDQTHLSEEFIGDVKELLETKRQLIFEGPPGSGKTYVAEKFARWFTGQSVDDDIPLDEHVEIVQFHQSYGYEDFVQGIRPETNSEGQLVYRVRDGIFLEMVERTLANPKDRLVLIIDEINRGNLSRIFGELLLLLEYRGQRVRLPYGSGDAAYLTIPENLYLIGTMNTADRSLSQIDYALRRRFYFVRFMPVENGRAEVYENWLARNVGENADRERLRNIFVNLNHGIRRHLGTDDLQVGHSYFMQDGIETDVVFDRVWRRAVRPLLEEYLHHHRRRDEILDDLLAVMPGASEVGAAPSASPDAVDPEHV